LLTAALEQRNILVLDEWAADQDPEFRKVFYERLLPILKAQGYTIFAISHDDKYFHLADRIVRMHQGVLQELSAADAAGLIAQPAVVS
jgi:putative ATP-binding cassette transporter